MREFNRNDGTRQSWQLMLLHSQECSNGLRLRLDQLHACAGQFHDGKNQFCKDGDRFNDNCSRFHARAIRRD